MERTVNRGSSLAGALLRVRLALLSSGPVLPLAVLLLVLGAGALWWLAPQRALQAERHRQAMRLASMPAVAETKSAPELANENLALFYRSLGERRYAEQQVRTLFALASKAGLSLSQGEYRTGYDRHARLHTYQVTLPVRGSYDKVWNFGLMALRAMPFSSLDEISFKRDSIEDAQVEARIRLTLYLTDQPGVPQ